MNARKAKSISMTILRIIGRIMWLSFRISFWLGVVCPLRVMGYLFDCAMWPEGNEEKGRPPWKW